MTHQIEQMVEQSQDWVDKITCGHMDRTNISIVLQTTIWKTLGYPLSSTLLNKEECETVMRPAIMAASQKWDLTGIFQEKCYSAQRTTGASVLFKSLK